MVVPVDTTVTLDINAQDVAHSWWIPKLGGKFDAIPGYTNHTWFKIPGKLAGTTLHRPVRRAVRAQPRQHERPGPRRDARRSSRRASTSARRDIKAADERRRAGSASRISQGSDPVAPDHGRHRTDRPRRLAARPADHRPRRRARARRGWTSWVTTTDHKRIGIMYLVLTFVFFMLGGVEALLMRLQLGAAEQHAADAADVQRAVHDARDDDDLPVRRADHGRLRQLLRAADDRRARHGVPEAQRAVLLAAGRRRASSSTARSSSTRPSAAGRATRRCRRDAVPRPTAASTPGSS